MLTRRKLFGLLAGAAVAPKELLAAPVATGAITLEMLQRAFIAAGPPPEWVFYYPADFTECFHEPITVRSPRMMFKIEGLTIPDEDKPC